ncbi:F-box/FBD/LRR-repeat protein At1g13570 [Linum grandiflorum]
MGDDDTMIERTEEAMEGIETQEETKRRRIDSSRDLVPRGQAVADVSDQTFLSSFRPRSRQIMSFGRAADRISSLPEEVRHHVLNFLPTRDAAMSSVLSTGWRNSWSYLPTLDFDDREIKLSLDDVSRVLMRHHGPLKEFSLSLSRQDSRQDEKNYRTRFPPVDDEFLLSVLNYVHELLIIDETLHLLPRRTITSLTVSHFFSHSRMLAMRMSMIYSFSQLGTLRLSNCVLDSPPVLFDNLTTLELRHVRSPRNSALWKFVCPSLTSLTLDRCGCIDFRSIAIVIKEAPKLSYFYLDGNFSSLQFNSRTPLLNEVFISVTSWTRRVESYLLKLVGALDAVESLSLRQYSYRVYITSYIINWLLNSSPALEQMEIRVWNEFIWSPEVSKIVKSANGFRRASSKAHINILRENFKDSKGKY